MEILQLAAHWKELGGLGVFLLAIVLCGKRLLDWVLEWAGVSIKRHQSREDDLSDDVRALGVRLDEQETRLSRLEQVYRITHQLAHRAADGIEEECENDPPNVKNIRFYVAQLRTIQTLEEIWGTPAAVVQSG